MEKKSVKREMLDLWVKLFSHCLTGACLTMFLWNRMDHAVLGAFSIGLTVILIQMEFIKIQVDLCTKHSSLQSDMTLTLLTEQLRRKNAE